MQRLRGPPLCDVLFEDEYEFDIEDEDEYEFDIEDIKAIRSYYKSKIEEEEFWIYTFGIAAVAIIIVVGGYLKI